MRDGRLSARRLILAAAAAAALLVLAVLVRPQQMTILQALLCAAVIAIGLAPLWLERRQAERRLLPLMPVFGLFHAAFFGLSLLLTDLAMRSPGNIKIYAIEHLPGFNTVSILLSCGGLLMVYGGYYGARRWLSVGWPSLRLPQPTAFGLRLAVWGGVALIGLILLLPPLQASSAVMLLGAYLRLALAGLIIAGYGLGLLRGAEALLLTATIIVFVLVEMLQFSLMTSAFLFVLWTALVFFRLRRGRVPVGKVLLVIVLFFVLYEARQVYRYNHPGLAPVSLSQPLSETMRSGLAYGRGVLESVPEAISQRLALVRGPDEGSSGLRRISFGLLFSVVVDQHQKGLEHWNGQTYANLLSNLVPRIFWPDKPQERWGGAFGLRYGLIEAADTQTSVNIPWLIEAYANFGAVGMMPVMFAIGLFLAVLDQVFQGRQQTPVGAVIGAAFMFRLGFPESNFTVLTGSIPSIALVIYGGLWALFRLTGAKAP